MFWGIFMKKIAFFVKIYRKKNSTKSFITFGILVRFSSKLIKSFSPMVSTLITAQIFKILIFLLFYGVKKLKNCHFWQTNICLHFLRAPKSEKIKILKFHAVIILDNPIRIIYTKFKINWIRNH